LYTSTNDGFLHAFKVAKGDPDDDAEFDPNQFANNELWSFMPPAVLTGLQSEYPGIHQVLLDGAPVVKDVVAETSGSSWVFQRTEANARFGLGQWRTVLVQAFGGTRGGYFAVDVTNPTPVDGDDTTGPQFLWQITTDSEGNPLFGAGGGTPLITTVFVDGVEVAVAVLPGGSGGGRVDGGSIDRADWDGIDEDYPARATVAEYENEDARSLTVVRLDSGEILRTFRHDATALPTAEQNANVITEVDIDSPITGQPVAFPAEVGAVADRLFVGDQNGGLWTVDVSSEDPEQWVMRLFFDGFPNNGDDLLFGATDGQPIATRPIISVDGENHLVVLFSTGDQESLASSTAVNQVFSLTEDTDPDTDAFVSKVNWFKSFDEGERVTGNMVLFSSQLYFSTFKPPEQDDVCGDGTSLVWGMHFLERETADDPSDGGVGQWQDETDPTVFTQYINPADDVTGDETTVFGVTLAQQPSCSVESLEPSDAYLGYGTHTSISQFTPGKFQLIMHTGSGSGQGASASAADNVVTKDLATPTSITTFDSWAAIVE
jgi:type IV pilus assembly protein PilY1